MLLYGATLTGAAAAFNLIWYYGRRRGLRRDGLGKEFRRDVDIGYLAGLIGYGVATLLALIAAWIYLDRQRGARPGVSARAFTPGRLLRRVTALLPRPIPRTEHRSLGRPRTGESAGRTEGSRHGLVTFKGEQHLTEQGCQGRLFVRRQRLKHPAFVGQVPGDYLVDNSLARSSEPHKQATGVVLMG
jgi:hypothetical protein